MSDTPSAKIPIPESLHCKLHLTLLTYRIPQIVSSLVSIRKTYAGTTAGQIAHDSAGVLVGNGDVVLIDGLYQGRLCFGAGFLVSKARGALECNFLGIHGVILTEELCEPGKEWLLRWTALFQSDAGFYDTGG